jgi:hypothetical protein
VGAGRVLVAGEDDYQTKGNPGRTKAEQAAAAARGRAVLPCFKARPEGRAATDFNDLHALEGLAAVRAQLEAARPRPPPPEAAPEAPDDGGWVPERAVDAQSLVAQADLVVSAGGTMNREAAALGVPAYTTFAGRLGAVDDSLVRDGRLRALASATTLVLEKRAHPNAPTQRDPALMLDLLLSALEG